jgi:hypothetical protein
MIPFVVDAIVFRATSACVKLLNLKGKGFCICCGEDINLPALINISLFFMSYICIIPSLDTSLGFWEYL